MNKNTIIAIVIVLAIILIGAFLFMDKPTSNDQTNNSNNTTPQTPVVSPEATSTPQATVGQVKSFTVTSSSFKFSPAEMRVKKGDRVKITLNNTQGFHDLTIDEFNVATKQINGVGTDVVEFVANKTGTFEYYCSVGNHRQMGMVGKLIVE
jgi:cytochrome c oxidase subunit II